MEEPDRSREQQSGRGHIVVKDIQPGQHHQCGCGCLAELVGHLRPRGRQHSRDHAKSRVSVVVGFLPRPRFSVEGVSDCSSNGLHAGTPSPVAAESGGNWKFRVSLARLTCPFPHAATLSRCKPRRCLTQINATPTGRTSPHGLLTAVLGFPIDTKPKTGEHPPQNLA